MNLEPTEFDCFTISDISRSFFYVLCTFRPRGKLSRESANKSTKRVFRSREQNIMYTVYVLSFLVYPSCF